MAEIILNPIPNIILNGFEIETHFAVLNDVETASLFEVRIDLKGQHTSCFTIKIQTVGINNQITFAEYTIGVMLDNGRYLLEGGQPLRNQSEFRISLMSSSNTEILDEVIVTY